MGAADNLTVERNWVATLQGHLISLRLSTTGTAEDDVFAVARPAQKMAGNSDLGQLTLIATARVHHPDFQPSAAVGLERNAGAIRRKKRVDVQGWGRSQLLQGVRCLVNHPDIRVSRPRREENQSFAVR